MFNDSIVVLIMLSMICPSRFFSLRLAQKLGPLRVLPGLFQSRKPTHRRHSQAWNVSLSTGPLVQLGSALTSRVIFARPVVLGISTFKQQQGLCPTTLAPAGIHILNGISHHTSFCDDPTIGGWENQGLGSFSQPNTQDILWYPSSKPSISNTQIPPWALMMVRIMLHAWFSLQSSHVPWVCLKRSGASKKKTGLIRHVGSPTSWVNGIYGRYHWDVYWR